MAYVSGGGGGGGGGGGWGASPNGANNGIYWVGTDGKVYVKGAQGTNAAGVADANTNAYWTSRGYNQVNDPNKPQSQVSGGPAPSGGSGGAGGAALNQAGINNTQMTIDQLPGLLEAALQAERTKYGNAVNEFNTQEQNQRKTYDTSTVTNQQNYDSTFMDSIRAGIKGLGGLMSLLRGTGAGGGTAETEARDTVGAVTAQDIRGGADTRNENQIALDGSLSSFVDELGRKRRMNEDTLVNNERAVRRDNSTQLQDLFGKMAGFYSDAGDTGNATNWMNRSGSLTPEIAQNSRTQVSAYDTAPVAVKAPELTAFAGPTQPSMQVAPDGQVGSGIFTMSDTRRRKDQMAPVGV